MLQEELGNLPEADLVQVDTEWVQRFHAILDIVRQAICIGAALLGSRSSSIIGNTIRLDIQNRRDEIEVTKLIGASNAFVRRPFLWTRLLVRPVRRPAGPGAGAIRAHARGARRAAGRAVPDRLSRPHMAVASAMDSSAWSLGWSAPGLRRRDTCGESSRASIIERNRAYYIISHCFCLYAYLLYGTSSSLAL